MYLCYQDRLADTGPSAASYLKKQRIQGVLDMWINTFFPPDPVDEEEKDDEDEDDY